MTQVRRGRPLGALIVGVGLVAAVMALVFQPGLRLAGAQTGCGPSGPSLCGPTGGTGATGMTGLTGPTGYPLNLPAADSSGGTTDQALRALGGEPAGTGSATPVAVAALAAAAVLVQLGVVGRRRRRSSDGTRRS